ncbi:hypothetical protein [Desulfosarcina sp.]|uniref:hypothetical protein n=1 Tax=Desulfosarcina sp. TaxID=2027861 RepID=UPI003970F00D
MQMTSLLSTRGKVTARIALIVPLLLAFMCVNAAAFTISVTDTDGAPISNFRWVIEEDATFHPVPGDPTVPALALNFHRSYMPVVLSGDSAVAADQAALAAWTPEAGKHYFVSISPRSTGMYAMGGAPVKPGASSASVKLNPLPTPTAQISIFVFQDTDPINNAPDLPQELGLPGFQVNLVEAGGRFGVSGGLITQDAFGNPVVNAALPVAEQTPGVLLTNADGIVIVKNLPPAKYGITVTPPTGSGWFQTSTIEGSPTIDAWVKANEPPYFTEFGPAGHHADFGFVQVMDGTQDRLEPLGQPDLNGSYTISGTVVSTHMSRPPDYTFFGGHDFPNVWVGLNDAARQGLYAAPLTNGSDFSIPNVPPGNYTVVFWDRPLDMVFAAQAVTITDQNVDMGEVGVFNWFTHLRGKVFFDNNQNGFPDPDDPGLSSFVTLRFRDGSVYDAGETEPDGSYAFDEVFPFFAWLVAEGDFAAPRRATGATIVVDAGGEVPPHNGWTTPSFDRLNPQPQPDNGGLPYRTEQGEVITQGFQGFLGQTNVIYWGKSNYDTAIGENGGVSGVVSYDVTRAENNPVDNLAEEWQPGVPRVPMALYQYDPATGDIADINGVAGIQLADVDHFPFGWSEGGVMGAEDIERSGIPGFDMGDAVQLGATDSWDDSAPDGCPNDDPLDPLNMGDKCYDGLRNFNQVRNAVYDGGYAFPGLQVDPGATNPLVENNGGIAPGRYIVEAVPPPGYKIGRAQDKNVDFGEAYIAPDNFPPECVGEPYAVPQFLALFPGEVVHPFYDPESLDYQGQPYDPSDPVMLPDCNRKLVTVSAGQNTPADFFVFTDTPVSGHLRGFILDDLANEFDPANPNFGEKYAPPWVPVGVYDYNGNPVTRLYSDQFGNYNGLVPSTYTTNIPSPSGMSPNMLIACMNDPGPVEVSPGVFDIDPYFKRQYSQFCYTFQYMPGTTTYLDTPVLPIAAFAAKADRPLDCEFPDGTPVILSVSEPTNGYGGGPYVEPGSTYKTLQITALGPMQVTNPAYTQDGAEPLTITRFYNFGASPGQISMVNEDGVSADFTIAPGGWGANLIQLRVHAGTEPGVYQLKVTRTNGVPEPITSPIGVSVTVGPLPGANMVRSVSPGGSIQTAIDSALPGDLILVAPGTYDEMVIMYKAVKLQGWGAPSVVINAVKRPGEKLQLWRQKLEDIVTSDPSYLLPGQTPGFDPANNEPGLLTESEGPGILVMGNEPAEGQGAFQVGNRARIDGVSITGADIGGAIVVNGNAHGLEIGNNRLFGNEGHYGGGIQVGFPYTDTVVDAGNDNLYIHNNWVSGNGSPIGYPGGIALYTGAHDYLVADNYICGNFATGSGGGIGHIGLSNNGRIADNVILFNACFNQMPMDIGGGGIAVEGAQVLNAITPGAGNVDIVDNLIKGNYAGSGDGAGIRLAFVNGEDVGFSSDIDDWYYVNVFNNMIVNNVTGQSGGGISLQDAVRVRIINNTIANNDSTATVGALITTDPVTNVTSSDPQPGVGIVSRANTTGLAAELPAGFPGYSDPTRLANNIIHNNRAFMYDLNLGLTQMGVDDLAVVGTAAAAQLDPRYSLLTDAAGYHGSNFSADPLFVLGYENGKSLSNIVPEDSTPLTAAATDEGGNYVEVRYDPITPVGDYHLTAGSSAVNNGYAYTFVADLQTDIDGDLRVHNLPAETFDIGADEVPGVIGGNVQCTGDLNFDQSVNIRDYQIFISEWGRSDCNDLDGAACLADLNHSGSVNIQDYQIFIAAYGQPCN